MLEESSSSSDVDSHHSEVDEGEVDPVDQAPVEDCFDPLLSARIKMEVRANHLIQQVDLIETVSRQRRLQSEQCRKAVNSRNIEPMAPPQLMAISRSSTSTTVSSRSDTSLPLDTPSVQDWMFDSLESEKPLSRRDNSLADELSSNDEAPRGLDRDRRYRSRIQELEVENRRLREMVSTCCVATLELQANTDLKVTQLEMDLAHIRERLSEELAVNAKVVVLNHSLRKQLNEAAASIFQKKHESLEDKRKFVDFMQLHQRELTVEKHLNGLILTRNQAVKESTALKKMLLDTCYDCRQRLPFRRGRVITKAESGVESDSIEMSSSTGTLRTSNPIVSKRPTYQSSARRIVKDKLATTEKTPPVAVTPPSSKIVKSCLKKSNNLTLQSKRQECEQSSPISSATNLSENGFAVPDSREFSHSKERNEAARNKSSLESRRPSRKVQSKPRDDWSATSEESSAIRRESMGVAPSSHSSVESLCSIPKIENTTVKNPTGRFFGLRRKK